MASTFVSAITVLASVGGVLAVGFEFKAFVDGKRHWNHGRIEIAASRCGWIRRQPDGDTYLLIEMKLMNTGYAPISLRQLFFYGMDYVPELMPNQMDLCPLLAPGESVTIPLQPKEGEDTWVLATYFDSSDSRFLFVQSMDFSYVESDEDDEPLYSTFTEWLGFLWRYRSRTIRPRTVSDVNLQAGRTAPIRLRRRARWSQRELSCLEEAIDQSGFASYIDLTPRGLSERLPQAGMVQDQSEASSQEHE